MPASHAWSGVTSVVGAPTRERVLRLIAEHGYQASFFAQNLATGNAYALGIVFPILASELVIHPVFPQLLGAVGGESRGEADGDEEHEHDPVAGDELSHAAEAAVGLGSVPDVGDPDPVGFGAIIGRLRRVGEIVLRRSVPDPRTGRHVGRPGHHRLRR